MKYIVLFVCSLVIPVLNTEATASVFVSYEIDFLFSMLSFTVYGLAIKSLKEDKDPILVILGSTLIEDIVINFFCKIEFITYVIQLIIIAVFYIYKEKKCI